MTAPAADERRFDLILLGATGFVGKLVCEEVAMNYATDIAWSIAGRDTDALYRVKEELCKMNPQCKGLEVLRFDVHDQPSVDKVVRQAKVVLSTTGPYELLGEPVVEACIRHGTHYADLCGEMTEVPQVRKMADKWHEEAAARKVKIVNSCGVEAIAADLSCYMVVQYMRAKWSRKCSSITTVVQAASGLGFGGGSWESIMQMLGNMPLRQLAAFQSPYFTCPKDARTGSDPPDIYVPGYCSELKQYTMPYLLASSDCKVVHRSNALLYRSYGDDFRYKEGVYAPGLLAALLGSLAMAALVAVMALRIFHPLLRLVTYRPGQGPQYQTQMKGFWKYVSVGRTQEGAGSRPRTVHVIMGDAGRDPGYWSTARMALDSGLCLALNQKDMLQEGLREGGVLTPASAMGMALVRRLRQAGYACIVRESHGLTI